MQQRNDKNTPDSIYLIKYAGGVLREKTSDRNGNGSSYAAVFYILSREAAETAGKLVDVSGNIKEEKVILVDAGHGGVDSGMVGVDGLKEKGINLEVSLKLKKSTGKKRLHSCHDKRKR